VYVKQSLSVFEDPPEGRPESRENWMIVEYTRYHVDERRRDAFLDDYRKAAEWLEASGHCLAYELTECAEAAGHYMLRLEWDSPEGHLEGFRKSPEFRSFFAHVQPYVGDIEEMRHYRPTGIGGRKP
jgi:hemoglobin